MDWWNNFVQNWQHYIPLAALISKDDVPENRPATTRIIEQAIVGIIAAAIASYVMIQIDHQEIADLKESEHRAQATTAQTIQQSEVRVTAQIAELRSFIMINKLRGGR